MNHENKTSQHICFWGYYLKLYKSIETLGFSKGLISIRMPVWETDTQTQTNTWGADPQIARKSLFAEEII